MTVAMDTAAPLVGGSAVEAKARAIPLAVEVARGKTTQTMTAAAAEGKSRMLTMEMWFVA
jgi:hypothetical protein